MLIATYIHVLGLGIVKNVHHSKNKREQNLTGEKKISIFREKNIQTGSQPALYSRDMSCTPMYKI